MKGKSKNKIFFPNLILLVLGLVVITYSVFNIFNLGLMKGANATVAVLNTMENEYYVVGKDPTSLQKEKFELLTAELEKIPRDNTKIASLVAESFVIDFFNWSNKDASYDVGGLQYMYDPQTFNKIAHYEYYQMVDVFKSAYGKSDLPEITDVRSNVKKIADYKLEDNTYEAFEATLNWDYQSSSKLAVNEFVKSCELILINDNGVIKIVEVTMVDEKDLDINALDHNEFEEGNEDDGYEQ